jgi:hypothetical protein
MSTPHAKLLKDFQAEVPLAFGFLADHGYEALAEGSGRFAWTSAELGVEVGFDVHEKRVVTVLDAFLGKQRARASLVCVYVETGCGPAQDGHETALSSHTLRRAVASQGRALAAALAALAGADLDVIASCHGR